MNRRLMHQVLLMLCLLWWIPSVVFSSNSYGYSVSVSMKDGLDNNTIYDIHYGSRGFIWFATDMGISRYDGFRVRNFPLISNENERPDMAVSRAVISITEGEEGLLCLRLLQGGIVFFDSNKEKYIAAHFDKPLNNSSILSFYLTGKHTLYIGTADGLYTGEIVRSGRNGEDTVDVNLSDGPLMKGEVSELVGNGKGQVFACIDRTKIVAYDPACQNTEFIDRKENGRITKLYLHGDYLWICPASAEIELYNPVQKTLHKIEMEEQYRDFLSGTSITDIVCTDDRNYFLATWNGLVSMNFDSGKFDKAACSFDCLEQSFPFKMERKITSLLWNEGQRILWVGTFGKGLHRMYCTERTYYSLEQKFDADVVGIEEDQQGYVWLLTKGGELWKSDSNQLSMETKFKRWTKGLESGETYRMYKDKHGHIWLGDSWGRVFSITTSTEEVAAYTLAPEGKSGLSEAVLQFCLDSRNRLWIVTTGHLVLFDYKKEESRLVSLEYEGQKVKKVYSIAEDKEGNIWLGTDIGLKRMDNQGQSIQLHGSYERDAGLRVSPVYSIYVNTYNQILASCSDKILRIDGREKGKVEKIFTLFNGLSSSHIYCMVDDENGNTWVGSNSGIITIRNDRDLLFNYASFGYSSEVCRLRDGRLLWASSLGLTVFDPQMVKTEGHKSALRLAEVWVNGEQVSVGKSLNGQVVLNVTSNQQRDFVFGAGNDFFTFYFSDLQYGIMQCRQAYRLLPDEDWKVGELENGVSFRRLPIGDYTLQVKLIYPDASESEVVEIPIRINTYWWDTVWARFGYFLAALGIVGIVYGYVERRGRRRVMHRTREMKLREKLNLTKIREEQKREMDFMRNQLLKRFMEELRTPLSLIIAPLKEMSQEQNLPIGVLSQLRVAYRNSLGMLDSCNQLLSIYTQDSLNGKLKVAPYAADKFMDKVVFSVNELVRINRIDFKYDKRIKKDLEIWVDNQRISFVLHNLLTNAFNHIRFSGMVYFSLQEMMRDGVRYCVITVEDNGKNQVKITNDALQLDLTGAELGYDVMEKIIQLHHGTIMLKSTEREGTEVVVELPVNKEVLQNDPNILFVAPESLDESGDTSVSAEEKSREVPVPEETVMEMAASEPVSVQREKKKLLIVEDHKDIRLYLKMLFGKEYDLLIATNGQEGVELAVNELPDLILCDVMMPVKDGFECCREIKENLVTCNIPFIMLTAKVEDEDVIHGLELGADDYILKPFTPGILKAKVHNLINGRVHLKQMYTQLLMPPEDGNSDASSIEEKVKVEDPFITAVVKIIEENMCEADFNVKKLASELNMSQPTLYRKVKQSTDFTIIELIRGVRMRKAAVLLKQKIYAVQEVVEMVGYNDIPTFRRHFVDAFGTTPSTYPNSETP